MTEMISPALLVPVVGSEHVYPTNKGAVKVNCSRFPLSLFDSVVTCRQTRHFLLAAIIVLSARPQLRPLLPLLPDESEYSFQTRLP